MVNLKTRFFQKESEVWLNLIQLCREFLFSKKEYQCFFVTTGYRLQKCQAWYLASLFLHLCIKLTHLYTWTSGYQSTHLGIATRLQIVEVSVRWLWKDTKNVTILRCSDVGRSDFASWLRLTISQLWVPDKLMWGIKTGRTNLSAGSLT